MRLRVFALNAESKIAMTTPETPSAWEPLTPRGVAAFARASGGRLWLVQSLVALIVAATVAWFLYDGWFPTVRQAIAQLPDEGQIRRAQLDWHGDATQLLAEGTFLAISVDLEHEGDIRSPAHVHVEFGKKSILFHSLLGYAEVKYPARWIVAFNRTELAPWWGAWQPALLAIALVGVVVWLFVSWCVLTVAYTLPVWVLVFFANRDLKLAQCWRLAGAALMPGALLMAVGILLYDFGVVDLVGLGFITGGHLVLGWIYLFVCPWFLPRAEETGKGGKNPFAPARQK